MTDSEVNKIIAEFMDMRITTDYTEYGHFDSIHEDGTEYWCDAYTHSLDSLVEVWGKLNYDPEFVRSIPDKKWTCTLLLITLTGPDEGLVKGKHTSDNIYQAAAHATAKAIIELKKVDSET